MTEVLLRSMSAASGRGRRSTYVNEQGQRRRTEVGKHGQQHRRMERQRRRVEPQRAVPDGL
jgi:hypothetical protein